MVKSIRVASSSERPGQAKCPARVGLGRGAAPAMRLGRAVHPGQSLCQTKGRSSLRFASCRLSLLRDALQGAHERLLSAFPISHLLARLLRPGRPLVDRVGRPTYADSVGVQQPSAQQPAPCANLLRWE